MIKKILKILAIIISVLFVIILVSYLYLTEFGRRELFTGARTKADLEVPVTYNIGWWAYQDALSIDSMNIKIEESRLHLFNSKSLISYTIIGSLKHEHWMPMIKEVHISERLNSDTTLNYDRIIELTPIVKVDVDQKNEEEIIRFNFKNEHIINSNAWGLNRVKFVCGTKEQIIELYQRK